jgi:flagellar biosynthetic protein FliP
MIARGVLVAFVLLFVGDAAFAQSLPAVTVDQLENGQQTYSLSIQVLALMTALTVLPALVLSMTAFTRIVIVLAILRQALGTPQTPPNQVLIGLALFLTLFVMSPVMTRAYDEAVVPYMAGEQDAMTAAQNAVVPLREFLRLERAP